MGNKQSQPNANTIDSLNLQVGDILLFTERGGKFLYNVRASAESPAGHEHIDIRLMRLLCHMEFSLRASIFPGSHAPQLLELQATRTTPAGPRWECAISFVTHPHTSSPCPHLDNFAQIETSDGQTKLCGHFPSTSGPRGVHPVSVQLLDAQLTSGAYDAVYVRRLLHRPSSTSVDSIRAYAKSAARHTAKAAAFTGEASPVVDGHKRHEDSSHSDEEVAILMEAPSRRSGPFMRFQDCTSPVERFTTSRLVAEMLKKAGQVTGEGHVFSASTADERLLAAVCELELDKRGNLISGRGLRGVVPGTLVTPEPTPYSHSWQ